MLFLKELDSKEIFAITTFVPQQHSALKHVHRILNELFFYKIL